MNQRERMEAGLIYDPADEDIMKEQTSYLDLQYEYNMTRPSETEKRQELMKRMFAAVGENCVVEPPFHANWAGHHISLGNCVYMNYGFKAVDDGNIRIGDHVLFGQNVMISTVNHPVDPSLRRKGYQYQREVVIEENVWVGSGAIILAGVTIGKNSVIGAGAVVTKDIPADVIAAGNPCRVIREITEEDRLYYHHGERIDRENLPE